MRVWLMTRSVAAYRVLLLAYPRSFRMRHGACQTQMFRQMCARSLDRGVFSFLFFLIRTVGDVTWNGIAERLGRSGNYEWVPGPRSRGAYLVRDFVWDLAFAFRSFRRRPGLIVATVVTLALGIGATLSVLTVVNSILVQPLKLPASDRLISIQRIRPNGMVGQLGSPDIAAIRDRIETIEQVGAYSVSSRDVGGIDQPVRTQIATVTGGFFDLLGLTPQLGRTLRPVEDQTDPNIVVLTHGTWQRRFGGARDIVGRSVTIDDRSHVIVGVLYPALHGFLSPGVEAFVPPRENFHHGAFWLHGLGRLRVGRDLAQARLELDALAREIATAQPDIYEGRGFTADGLLNSVTEHVRPLLLILLAAVALVLIVATANVANLWFVRTRSRQREFAIRSAIGAGRSRLVRQLTAESILLGLVGGCIGLLVSRWTTAAVLTISPSTLPRQDEVGVGGVIFAAAISVSIVIGLFLGGVGGAWLPASGTGAGSQASGANQSTGWSLKNILVVSQIAIALVLVVGSGLLTKSFFTLTAVDPGFHPNNVISFRVSLPGSYFAGRAEIAAFHRDARERIGAVPGVSSVASISINPFNGGNLCSEVAVTGKPDIEIPCAEFRSISPGYFEVTGTGLDLGRDVTGADDDEAPPVAVVNQTFARMAWANESPLGKRFTIWDHLPHTEVIGVSTDVRQFALDRPAVPEIYMPQTQFPFRYARYLVRTDGPPDQVTGSIQAAVWEVNPNVPVAELVTMRELVANSVAEPRFRTLLMSAVAFLAFSVAIVGVSSLVAFSVTQRVVEIGVRIALGASRKTVMIEVVRSGMRLAVLGVLLGLVGSVGVAQVLERFLFGVRPLDWSVLTVSVFVVLLASLFACLVPGRKASRVDPLPALRGTGV